MVTEFNWTAYAAAAAEAMDGANLNSLATGCAAAAGEASDTITEIDNSTALDFFADFYLDLASLNIAISTGYCSLYIIPVGSDGSTYPHYVIDHSTSGNVKLPYHYFVRNINFNLLNGAQMQCLRKVEIPGCKFRVALVNQLGVSFAASGNTLKYRTYSEAGN